MKTSEVRALNEAVSGLRHCGKRAVDLRSLEATIPKGATLLLSVNLSHGFTGIDFRLPIPKRLCGPLLKFCGRLLASVEGDYRATLDKLGVHIDELKP